MTQPQTNTQPSKTAPAQQNNPQANKMGGQDRTSDKSLGAGQKDESLQKDKAADYQSNRGRA
jgi:hypothetical protein